MKNTRVRVARQRLALQSRSRGAMQGQEDTDSQNGKAGVGAGGGPLTVDFLNLCEIRLVESLLSQRLG